MKAYKLRHKPTGLFFKASKHRSKENLSVKGKVYQSRPSLGMLLSTYHHPDDAKSPERSWNHYPGRPVIPEEWEIVVYEYVETGVIQCK